MALQPFTDEQARALIHLEQRYRVWIEAERDAADLPYDLRRKDVGGYAYLYEITDRSGNGRSLAPWSADAERRFREYRASKQALKDRREGARARLEEAGRLCRAMRVPMLASLAGPILREADRRRLLDGSILVVGTNAMAAYAIEASGAFRDVPDETEDFDLAWSASQRTGEPAIGPLLKAIDPTYVMNSERTFQARNARAYEVELLVAPSLVDTLPHKDWPRPVPLPEQEWLLLGQPVDRVVICRDASAARIVAPDPRWFALQKLWMSRQAKRNSLKRPKDLKQGMALLDAIWTVMPQFPLDEAFEASVPEALASDYGRWRNRRPDRPTAGW